MLKARSTAAEPKPAPPQDGTPAPITGPAEASNIEAVDSSDHPGVWQALMQQLSEKGPGLLSLLSHGKYVGVIEGRATIRYAPHHETFVKMFERNGKKDTVREAMSNVLQQNVGVAFEVDAGMSGTPGAAAAPAAPVAEAKQASSATPQAARAENRYVAPAPSAPQNVRPTQQQIDELRETDPLIKTLLDDFNATVLKIE